MSAALAAALLLSPLSAQATETGTPREGTGLALPSRTMTPQLRFGTGASSSGLPDSVDLRAYAVTAGDQGSLNSCVSWAIGHTILGWYANKLGTPTDFAPMYIYSQTHLSNQSDGGGSYVSDAVRIADTQGVDTEADYQPQGDYDFTTAPTAAQVANATPYLTLGDSRLYVSVAGGSGAAGQNLIESALAAGRPVALGIPIYASFYYLDSTDYDFTTADATGSNYGYHLLAVLGYDPDGVWVENSWGTDWGQNGFAHLSWDFVNAQSVEADAIYGFSASTLPPYARPAPPSPTPTPSPIASATPDPTRTTPVVVPSDTTTVAPQPAPTLVSTPVASDPTLVPVTTTPVVNTPPSDGPPSAIDGPTAPRHVSTSSTTTAVAASWASPGSTGGGDVSGYRVTLRNGGSSRVLDTVGPSARFTGLAPDTAYTLSVQAQNAAGLSVAASAVAHTLAVAPTLTTVTVGVSKNVITLRWRARTVGSSTVSRYLLTATAGKRVYVRRSYSAAAKAIRITLPRRHEFRVTITVVTSAGKTATSTRTVRTA